jgi:molybdate transport system substrate-binding protein
MARFNAFNPDLSRATTRRSTIKWLAATVITPAAVGWPATRALAQSAAAVRVAAAANLQPALTEIVALFASQGGAAPAVTVTYGSSANLVRQIQQGLPADLFLSADEALADRLVAAGLTLEAGAVYAVGRLALLVPSASGIALDAQLNGLKTSLPQITKFALANPELAPYGHAAVEALQKTGLWPALQGKLVMGDNIAQATQYVTSGAAQAGLTALSLAREPAVAARTRHVVVAADMHAPLRQRMVLLKLAGTAPRAFYAFMQSPEARAVLARHGYE